ncbi:hypothetical protein MNBD_GAMMA22-2413 [hydrothermal vent metagenome]|uniref:YfaZ n=1 Tax=hydrothermal vent metagenome TaxID=652676 RepID=A0A3B1A4Q3_9ZZZZ
MLKRIFIIGLSFCFGAPVFAGSINAQLSNDAARFMYTGGGATNRLQYEAGVIYDSNQDYLAMSGLLVSGENMDAPIVASLGIRAYYGEVTNDSIPTSTAAVIALGGDLSFSPVTLPGFEFGGHYYIAPDPVSFGDSNKLIDFGIRAGYQVIPLSTLFIGYQSVTVDIVNQGKVIVDEGIIFGMKFTF